LYYVWPTVGSGNDDAIEYTSFDQFKNVIANDNSNNISRMNDFLDFKPNITKDGFLL